MSDRARARASSTASKGLGQKAWRWADQKKLRDHILLLVPWLESTTECSVA
jgi:hypothetical protein